VVRDALACLLAELGADLRAVWLYGSRARGEPGHDESDVDLLVLTRNGRSDFDVVYRAISDAAVAQGASPAFFSVWVEDPEWLAQRRSVRSFFIQEVDRERSSWRTRCESPFPGVHAERAARLRRSGEPRGRSGRGGDCGHYAALYAARAALRA